MVETTTGLALRQVKARRLRAILTTLGIILGVGMVYGVLLLSGTIRATMDDIVSSAWGSKDLIIMPRGGTLPDSALTKVQADPDVSRASGMVGGIVVRFDSRGRPIKGRNGQLAIAGYDTRTPAPYDFVWTKGGPPQAGLELVVERNYARDHGIDVGERLAVGTGAGRLHLPVVGIFKFSNGLNFGGQGVAAMPIGEARRIFELPHGWHQISLSAKKGTDVGALQKRLERSLGAGAKVQTPQGLGNDFKKQMSALDVVLYFFAGVALFLGGFLILNSFNMTIAQRMRELGMLRTLGADRRLIRRSVMLEASILGLLGSFLGLLLGLGLALGLIALIRGFGIPVGDIHIAPGTAVVAVALGLVATGLGAWWPARRAARIAPVRAALGAVDPRQKPSRRRIAIGIALYLPGAILGGSFWFGSDSSGGLKAMGGIALTMAMFVGMAMCAPVIIMPLVRALSAVLRRLSPTGGRLASDAARRNPSRTASTAIALTVGLSVIVVNGAMSASFIGSVHDRIDRTYARDVTVQPLGQTTMDAGARTVGPDVQQAIAALPDTGTVSPMRYVLTEFPGLENSAQSNGLIEGVDPRTIGAVDRPDPQGISDAAVPAALARGEALVARGYAQVRHLGVGDRVVLAGPNGRRSVRVAGIFDEWNEFGGNIIRVSSATMRSVYGATGPALLLVRARSKDRAKALSAEVDRLLARDYPEIEAQSTAEIKSQIDGEINQQFALFNAITAVAVIVSLLGVINTLAMSVIERTREIGVLRALGSSRWLVRMTMVQEGLLITVSGAVAGLALGALIAFMWVQSLDTLLPNVTFRLPVGLVTAIALAAILLGILAASLPARRAARLDVVDALAYE